MDFNDLAEIIDKMTPSERTKIVMVGRKYGMEYFSVELVKDMFDEYVLVED
jgi:hypothetical protein